MRASIVITKLVFGPAIRRVRVAAEDIMMEVVVRGDELSSGDGAMPATLDRSHMTQSLTSGGPIKTTICELVKSPERFNSKMVQVRARVATGFETSLLVDDSCSGHVWLETCLSCRKESGPPIALKRDAEYQKMQQYLDMEYKSPRGDCCISCPLYSVTVTATGLFQHADKKGIADPKRRMLTGFGHLNAYESQLVLESVKDVPATPIDKSKYKSK